MCVASPLLLWLSHVCLRSHDLQWLSLPVLGSVWSLSCYWARPRLLCEFTKATITWYYKVLSCVVLREAFVGGPGLQWDQMSALSPLLGLPQTDACGYILFSMGQDPLLGAPGS